MSCRDDKHKNEQSPELQFATVSLWRFGQQTDERHSLLIALQCFLERAADLRGLGCSRPFCDCGLDFACFRPMTCEHFWMRLFESRKFLIDRARNLPMQLLAAGFE